MAKKAQVVNPLDILAQPAQSASKSKQFPVIQANFEVQEAVDRIISLKAQQTKIEQELAEEESIVIEVIKTQQAADAREGRFSKSYAVPGVKGNLTATMTDKWSVTKDPIQQDQIRDITGKNFFNNNYTRRRLVELLDPVQTNAAMMTAILKIVTDSGIEPKDGFKVVDSLTTKPGLDQRQYELTDAQLLELTPLCKQNKPSFK